ncbi:MAG TPA: hypothetical protein DCE18_03200, partial [Syntrophobacteraceae bacterium]|nr:hypothetical protein [Syntrophobacteraceae bacterium]
ETEAGESVGFRHNGTQAGLQQGGDLREPWPFSRAMARTAMQGKAKGIVFEEDRQASFQLAFASMDRK